jgi:hypothetical protein
MSLLETLKDLLSGPEASFQKLLAPDYFTSKRQELDDLESYAKWLRQILVEFGAMAIMQKDRGAKVPELWLEGIRKIEDEIDRVRNEGGESFLPGEGEPKMSDQLK